MEVQTHWEKFCENQILLKLVTLYRLTQKAQIIPKILLYFIFCPVIKKPETENTDYIKNYKTQSILFDKETKLLNSSEEKDFKQFFQLEFSISHRMQEPKIEKSKFRTKTMGKTIYM